MNQGDIINKVNSFEVISFGSNCSISFLIKHINGDKPDRNLFSRIGTSMGSILKLFENEFPWHQIPPSTQRLLLPQMIGKEFNELYLSNCVELTSEGFLTFEISGISVLDVSGCKFVDTFISTITKIVSLNAESDVVKCVPLGRIWNFSFKLFSIFW